MKELKLYKDIDFPAKEKQEIKDAEVVSICAGLFGITIKQGDSCDCIGILDPLSFMQAVQNSKAEYLLLNKYRRN
jgi:hypothetical protein